MTKSIYSFCFLTLSGCSTVAEVLIEGSSPTEYSKTTDSSGNSMYVRQRVLSPSEDFFRPSPLLYSPIDFSSVADEASFANTVNAENSVAIDGEISNSLAVSISANENTANGDLSFEWLNEYMSGGVGIAFVSSDKSYFGFNAGVRAHFPWTVSPFVGVGLYGGDSKTCTYENLGYGYQNEICEKYFLMAVTADAGIQLTLNEHVRARFFTRGFSQARQGDPLGVALYGMSLGVLF